MNDGGERLGETKAFKELPPKNTLFGSPAHGMIFPFLGIQGYARFCRGKGGKCSIITSNSI
jgi:hypothetical protein